MPELSGYQVHTGTSMAQLDIELETSVDGPIKRDLIYLVVDPNSGKYTLITALPFRIHRSTFRPGITGRKVIRPDREPSEQITEQN